jgi:hypothetical protein
MKRSKKDSAEQLNRNEWMRESGSFSSKGYLSRGLLISWGPEKRGLQGSQGEWPVPGDFSDSQLLELAWLGRGQDSTPSVHKEVERKMRRTGTEEFYTTATLTYCVAGDIFRQTPLFAYYYTKYFGSY